MRYGVALAAALSLAGCGDGKDFTVGVEGDVAQVKRNLAKVGSGGMLTGVAPARMSSEGDSLVFKIATAPGYDPAEIRFDLVPFGNRTKVEVSVDVPEVAMGADQYLSEAKVEDALEKDMRAWAGNYEQNGSNADTSEIALTMSLIAVAAQRVDIDNVGFASDWAAGDSGEVDFDSWAAGDDSGTSYDEAAYSYEEEDDGGWGDGS